MLRLPLYQVQSCKPSMTIYSSNPGHVGKEGVPRILLVRINQFGTDFNFYAEFST